MPAGFEQGELIDDAYEVVERIGEGGFGDVYRVRQLSMSRDVALKILLQKGEESEHLAGRFRREVLAVRNLSHPNTVRIFDFSETPEGYLYYTMEYLEGQTLTHRIRESEGVNPSETREVLVQVLKSLSEAHSRGIVHRDLKPGNVMLADVHGETNFVKVLDFGIAKAAQTGSEDLPDEQLTSSENIVGTLRYMAPEQAKDDPIGPYTDLYTLGLVGLELMTGEKVFAGLSNVQILKEQLSPDPIEIPEPLFSSPLGQILRQALEKNIEERYGEADRMREELEALSDEELERSTKQQVQVPSESPGESSREPPEEGSPGRSERNEERDPEEEGAAPTKPPEQMDGPPGGPPPVPSPSEVEEGVGAADPSPDSEELETIPPETGPEDAPAESKATEKVDSSELEMLRQNLADGEVPGGVPVHETEGEVAGASQSNSGGARRVSSADSTTEDDIVPEEMGNGGFDGLQPSSEFGGSAMPLSKRAMLIGGACLSVAVLFFLFLGGESESSGDGAGSEGESVYGTGSESPTESGRGSESGEVRQVRVTTPGTKASVYRDGRELGTTPLEVDVDGEMELVLRSGEAEETVRLTPDSPALTEVSIGSDDASGSTNDDTGIASDAGADAPSSERKAEKVGREGGGGGSNTGASGGTPSPATSGGGSMEPEERPLNDEPEPPAPDPDPAPSAPQPSSGTTESAPPDPSEPAQTDESDEESQEDEVEVPVFE